MKTHELKTWPEFFIALAGDVKTFEFRKDDRQFALGDTLILREWHPGGSVDTGNGVMLDICMDPHYTGRVLIRWVSYLMRGPEFGLPEGYVIMSLKPQPPWPCA